MKLIIATLIKKIFQALLGKRMGFWGAEYMAKLSDNLVDDNVVAMFKAADDNDPEKIILHAQKVIEEAMKLLKD